MFWLKSEHINLVHSLAARVRIYNFRSVGKSFLSEGILQIYLAVWMNWIQYTQFDSVTNQKNYDFHTSKVKFKTANRTPLGNLNN